ncbi:MAG TPA: long-chain-fatty-acid--CoA ligase, partial [Gammaproteobacteria bacterium]|nr:long-chain-fatty-acid--CoA ligase [Gammaproteobacteria bacterium]
MFDRHLQAWPRFAPRQLRLPQTSVYTNLEVSALRYADQPAINYYDTDITYAELKHEAEAIAGYLQQLGVKKGDRVLLFMQNSPQFIIGFYGILRADAVVIPINPMNRTAELEHYIKDTGAAVAICGQELFPALAPLVGTHTLQHVIVAAYSDYVRQPTDLVLPDHVAMERQKIQQPGVRLWSDAIAAGVVPGPHTAGPDDLAVFPYSSGTTGAPKGCVHTHRSVMATLVGGVAWIPSSAGSVVLGTLPMFHVTGMQACMNSPIFAGSKVVLMTRWERRTAAKLIERYQVSGWTNIATMAIDFLSDPDIAKHDLSSLAAIGGGGAAMPAAVEEKLFQLTGLRYTEGYGLSETMAGTHINPPDAPKAQCLGIPVFDVDSRVVDVETGRECGVGEVGEIITHAPQVFQGYWNRPEATAEAFLAHAGKRFFRTGDLGYYDADGYFFLVDRVKRMINASGFKVWPSEVEALLYRHPAIQEACVIAAPDARRGETVKALVVLAAGATLSAEALMTW